MTVKRVWVHWTDFLINGEWYPRVPFEPGRKEPQKCEHCHVQAGKYHKLGCFFETCPCPNKEHKYYVECECPMEKEEKV